MPSIASSFKCHPRDTGLEELETDIDRVESAWNMMKEFLAGLDDMGKQSWIVFRANLFDLQETVE